LAYQNNFINLHKLLKTLKMKKITLLASVVIAASFASCKKDYTCVCTYTYAGTTETYTYDLGKIKKKDAKASCDAAGSLWVSAGGTCEAKVK
jgi:hypothetical protein